MDIYASDEEKAEAIKQWWRDNGISVVTGVVLGLAVIVGGRYWFSHQDAQNEQASAAYFQAVEASRSNEEALPAATDELMEAYPKSAYSVFAALQTAEIKNKTGDFAAAETYLTWVMNKAKLSAHKELARYRLAKVMLEQDKADEALDLLGKSSEPAFASLVAELEGDIYVLKNDAEAAQKAYEKAMEEAEPNDSRQGLLQIKLNDVATTDEG